MKRFKIATASITLTLAALSYCYVTSRPLEFSQELWKTALKENDKVSLYRMSKDLSEKIDTGLIRSQTDAEEILSVKEFGRIPLSRPTYFVFGAVLAKR